MTIIISKKYCEASYCSG